MSRPRSVLLQEQKKDPAAAAAPPPPAAPTRSRPAAAAAAAPGRPARPSLRLRPGPTAPASRARSAPALLVTQGEWWGAGGGRPAARAGPGVALGGPERHGTPARPERVADGGVRGRGARPPAQETQRRRRHPVVVARASTPCAPGVLPNSPSGTIPGVRPPGVGTLASGPRASLARVPVALVGGARRGQPDPRRQRGGGGGRAPGPRSSHPLSSPQPPRGSRLSPGVGAGPAG